MTATLWKASTINAFSTALNGNITDSDTTITLESVSGLQYPGVLVIDRVDLQGDATNSLREYISFTGISSNNITGVTRGLGGSTNQEHLSGAVVEEVISVSHWNDLLDSVLVEHNSDGTHKSALVTTLKATGAEVTTGTSDLKIVTPKALADSGIVKSTDGTLASNSDSKVPTEKAVKTYVDVSSGSKTNLYENSLINGGFDIWQRNTTFTPNDDVYTADQWNFLTETNGAWTIARDTDVPSALGFKYSAKFTNVTLNNQCAIVQFIKNVDSIKLDDQVVSLSFYAKTSGTEIANLRAAVLSWSSTADAVTSDVIGTWAQDGTTPTWAANWTAENTPSNLALTSSWQRFTIENVTIDTASMANIAVVIWVDDGTIAANDDFWITGVQLNQGATAKSWSPKSFDAELSDCMEFYEKSFDYVVAPADAAATEGKVVIMTTATSSFHGIALRFLKRKFSIPVVSLYNPAASSSDEWRNENDNTNHPASADTIGQTGCRLYVNSSSVAAGKTLGIHYTAEAVL